MFGNSLAATSGVLTNSTPVQVDLAANTATLTVYVRPAAGDTVTVEYTLDGTNWTAWDNGSVTAYSVDILDAPVLALRFTRTAGSGTTSAYGIL